MIGPRAQDQPAPQISIQQSELEAQVFGHTPLTPPSPTTLLTMALGADMPHNASTTTHEPPI